VADLSPAAQAVLNRTAEQVLADRRINMEHITAAALRAAAAHLGSCNASTELLAIATELEGQ
jgi:hypothetical protein